MTGKALSLNRRKENTMKKVWLALLAGVMLAGCTKTAVTEPETSPEATEETTVETTTETTEENAMIAGGWTVNDSYNVLLADDEEKIFEQAMEGLVGVGYTPIQVIATQLVSGTNYAYLASGTTVTANPETNYYVIVIYNSLDGNVEITSIKQIEIPDVKAKEGDNQEALGAWEVRGSGKAGMLPNEDAQASFDAASEKLLGVRLNPIVLLGSQVVAGTNYLALCRGITATENAETNLYVVKWNQDPQGNSEILENNMFDLEYYVTPEE